MEKNFIRYKTIYLFTIDNGVNNFNTSDFYAGKILWDLLFEFYNTKNIKVSTKSGFIKYNFENAYNKKT